MSHSLILISLALLAYGVLSKRLRTSVVTPPIVYVLLGLLAGPAVLGWVGVDVEHGVVHHLGELTLATILFVDAARLDLVRLRERHTIPVRLLSVALPLGIILGGLTAWLVYPSFSMWEAIALGAIVAPTDAALARAVVHQKAVPVAIRQAINVESGLNDGIAVPAVLIFIALAAHGHAPEAAAAEWTLLVTRQLALGPIVGVGVALVSAWLLKRALDADWIEEEYLQLGGVAVVFLSLGVAGVTGANGFIAAFVAGIVIRLRAPRACDRMERFGTAMAEMLALMTFLAVGIVLLPSALPSLDWRAFAYGFASLFVVRLIAVGISMFGVGLQPMSVLFLGWFGPRGVASILFALIVLEQGQLEHGAEILGAVTATVLGSVLLHGMSAAPLAAIYGRECERRAEPDAPEMQSVDTHSLGRA